MRVNFRFNPEEERVLSAIIERAKNRSRGYAPVSDICKELMGLIPLNLVSIEDLALLPYRAPIQREKNVRSIR
jgi:hypothetical protein